MNRKKLSVIFFVGFAIISGCGKSVSEIKDSNLVENDTLEGDITFSTEETSCLLYTSMQNSPVDVVSTDTVKLNLSRWIQTAKRHSNSNLPLSVVLFLRNTSQQLVKVSKKLLRQVFLADSQFLVFTLTYTMDLTMRSTLLKWHSTSLDL